MHTAAADVDKPARLDSVLTAAASIDQVTRALPQMDEVDPLASPGPARVARVRLSTGHPAAVVFHERKNFVEILVPLEAGVEKGLAEMLVRLHIPAEEITWTSDRIDREKLVAHLNSFRLPLETHR
jgi:hypothetical protein